MEVTALCLRSIVFEVFLLSTHIQDAQQHELHIVTSYLQFFEYQSISFRCEGLSDSSQLKGIRTNTTLHKNCTKSLCTIRDLYESDSGEYWCETETERSSPVNITVTHGSVILESPAVPIPEGSTVTMRCKNKTNSKNLTSQFYKDGVVLKEGPSTTMTIQSVSKTDEGLYKCNIPGGGMSPESWLRVEEPPPVEHQSAEGLKMMWIAVTVLIGIAIMLVILALYVGCLTAKHRGALHAPDVPHTPDVPGPENGGDDPKGVIYAAVVTKHRNNNESVTSSSRAAVDSEQHSVEEEVIYSAVRTGTKTSE